MIQTKIELSTEMCGRQQRTKVETPDGLLTDHPFYAYRLGMLAAQAFYNHPFGVPGSVVGLLPASRVVMVAGLIRQLLPMTPAEEILYGDNLTPYIKTLLDASREIVKAAGLDEEALRSVARS